MSLNVFVDLVPDYLTNIVCRNAIPIAYLLIGILAGSVGLPDLMHRFFIELRASVTLCMFYLGHGFKMRWPYATYISVPFVKAAVMKFYSSGQRPFVSFIDNSVRMIAASAASCSAISLLRQTSLPDPTSAYRIFNVLHAHIPGIVSRDKTFGFAFQVLEVTQVGTSKIGKSSAATKAAAIRDSALQALGFVIGADLSLNRLGHILSHRQTSSLGLAGTGSVSALAGPFHVASIIPDGASV